MEEMGEYSFRQFFRGAEEIFKVFRKASYDSSISLSSAVDEVQKIFEQEMNPRIRDCESGKLAKVTLPPLPDIRAAIGKRIEFR